MPNRVRDLTGHRNGKLTVLRLLRKDFHGYVWLCHGDCGREVELVAKCASVWRSCGNCQTRLRDLTGTRRGTWQVVGVANADKHTWHCRCIRCGRKAVLPHADFSDRWPRACGCMTHPRIQQIVRGVKR